MSDRNREKECLLAESDEEFQYEEEDWSLTEDFEATVKGIRAAASGPTGTSITPQPEAVEDFLRTFLLHMNMTETLDCFQTEWTEMLQKEPVDTEPVPDVYTENQRLDSELRTAHLEAEEYRLAAAAGAETLARLQRDRDLHRLQHKRVVREKNRLIEEMRRLKVRCDDYEPAVKRMNEKYQAVLKQQSMLVTLERDKVKGQIAQQHEEGAKGATHPLIQPRPPTNSPRRQTRVKANVC